MLSRLHAGTRRALARRFARRPLSLDSTAPVVSFTFDDAPRSAFVEGAHILEAHGARGTYYTSLGLLGQTTELGEIAGPAELTRAVERDHELACHTYDHHDAWFTAPRDYVASVARNAQRLDELVPGYTFANFAYPKSGPTVTVKRLLAGRFASCRGGGQTFNAGVADLNHLRACFVDRRARMTTEQLEWLIDANARAKGWLIFAAHAVSDAPSDFACAPSLLEFLLRRSLDAGASVLTVRAALAHYQKDIDTKEGWSRREESNTPASSNDLAALPLSDTGVGGKV